MTRDCCFCYCFLFFFDEEDVCNGTEEGEGVVGTWSVLMSLSGLVIKNGELSTASVCFSSRAAIFFLV